MNWNYVNWNFSDLLFVSVFIIKQLSIIPLRESARSQVPTSKAISWGIGKKVCSWGAGILLSLLMVYFYCKLYIRILRIRDVWMLVEYIALSHYVINYISQWSHKNSWWLNYRGLDGCRLPPVQLIYTVKNYLKLGFLRSYL